MGDPHFAVVAAPMLGASGAIYGVLVAFDLLSGVTGFSLFGAGVAHFAHLGGAAIGFARHRRRETRDVWFPS